MAFTVVILSKNPDNLTPCVAAVMCQESWPDILVVDDGLPLDWAPTNDEVEIIEGAKPFIFARNVNRAIARRPQKDIVLLNDDAILGTYSGFSLLERFSPIGIVAPSTNVTGQPLQRPEQATKCGHRIVDKIPFVCVYIPRKVIDVVGLFDERFTAYGWEDNDYCRRVRNAGFSIVIDYSVFVDHGSLKSSFRGDPKRPADIGPAAAIYRQKWGDLT